MTERQKFEFSVQPRPCAACGATHFEPLTQSRSPRIPELTLKIAICRDCGFVTQHPLPTHRSIENINARWFGEGYAPCKSSENFSRWEKMWSRLLQSGMIPAQIKHALDIGAQSGNALLFLKQKIPGIQLSAIEPMPEFIAAIVKKTGAEVVACAFEEAWPAALHGKFDLIVFRHTLEHLEDPNAVLKNISRCLSPTGKLYLVVPNCMNIRAGHPMRTDAFRPVHLHYFNTSTLQRLAARQGLMAEVVHEEGELWGFFENNPENAAKLQFKNTYSEQKKYLRARIQDAFWTDAWATARIRIKRGYYFIKDRVSGER